MVSAQRPHALVVTCEHAGNQIPPAYVKLFAASAAVLHGHRGWDPGALPLAERISAAYAVPLFAQTVSRLLVDNNRSEHNPRLFSEYSATLTLKERAHVLETWYRPHRRRIEAHIGKLAATSTVVHIAVHSFTPVLGGVPRNADIGLLYDPGRKNESAFCHTWREALLAELPAFSVRMNYPYRGSADGLTTHLRKRHPRNYLGVELELNQKHWVRGTWGDVALGVVRALGLLVDAPAAGRMG